MGGAAARGAGNGYINGDAYPDMNRDFAEQRTTSFFRELDSTLGTPSSGGSR